MMRRDGVDDFRRFAILSRQLGADDRVGTLHLMIHSFADIMEQSGAARLFFIQSELRRHATTNKGRLNGMQQNVLRIAVTVLETPQQFNDLGVNTVDTDVENRLLSRFT